MAKMTSPPTAQNNKADLNAYRKKKAAARRKPVAASAVLALFLVFAVVVIYLGRGVYSLLDKQDVATVAVEFGSVDLPVVLNGLIIRDEKVYASPADGTVVFNYDDKERVKSGAQVCSVQNEAVVSQLTDEMAGIEAEILKLQERRDDISGFSQDARRVMQQIQDTVDNSRKDLIGNNLKAVYALRENIDRSMNIRNNMLLSESRGSVKDMVDLKAGYEEQLSKSIAFMSAAESGVVSYTIDGLEETVNFETMSELTPEQCAMTVDYGKLERKKQVQTGDPVFKLVASNEWYIGTYVPKEMASEWQEGDDRTIYIERNDLYTALDMRVAKLSPGIDKDYVLFHTRKGMADFLDVRGVKLKLSDSERRGLKIPFSTIVDRTLFKVPNSCVTEAPRVSVTKKGVEANEIVELNVSRKDDNFTYFFQDENLRLKVGDILIGSEEGSSMALSEVINVKGVYVLHTGYADFVEIHVADDKWEQGDYVVLDPELNPNLRVNDQIVYDTKALTDGMKVLDY